MADLKIEPAKTALVVIDLQRGIVSMPAAPRPAVEVVERAAQIATALRQAGGTVVFVHVTPSADRKDGLRPITDAAPAAGWAPPPDWADLVLAADDPRLVAVRSAVRANPQAATVLAVLLRSGGARSIPEGLLAESTAYGLLQGGPEFARWRSGRSVRHRATGDGPAVLVRRRDDELWVTLNRPRVLNALDSAMRDELETALHVAVMDPSITSVHLDGAGPSFCSGGDLQEFGTRSDPPSAHLVRLLRNPARTIAELADRTVAHLHGDVVGSGVELAAFAHRVVAARSTRLSLPEVRLGLIPGAGGTVSLPRRIGRHRTLLLALAVQSVDAATALDWGLVDEVSG